MPEQIKTLIKAKTAKNNAFIRGKNVMADLYV